MFPLVSLVFNRGPISQKPFRFLAQRSGDILEPRPDQKAKMKVDQYIDPSAGSVNGDAHVLCQIAIYELVGQAFGQQFDQQFKLIDLLDLG